MTDILTESYCERCGAKFTFESPRAGGGPVSRARVLARGLRNYLTSEESLEEALAEARREQDRQASGVQLRAFHDAFSFCFSCRQYTCRDCWNPEAGRCRSCAPMPGVPDPLDAALLAMAEEEATPAPVEPILAPVRGVAAAGPAEAGAAPSPAAALSETSPVSQEPVQPAAFSMPREPVQPAAVSVEPEAVGPEAVEPPASTVEIEVPAVETAMFGSAALEILGGLRPAPKHALVSEESGGVSLAPEPGHEQLPAEASEEGVGPAEEQPEADDWLARRLGSEAPEARAAEPQPSAEAVGTLGEVDLGAELEARGAAEPPEAEPAAAVAPETPGAHVVAESARDEVPATAAAPAAAVAPVARETRVPEGAAHEEPEAPAAEIEAEHVAAAETAAAPLAAVEAEIEAAPVAAAAEIEAPAEAVAALEREIPLPAVEEPVAEEAQAVGQGETIQAVETEAAAISAEAPRAPAPETLTEAPLELEPELVPGEPGLEAAAEHAAASLPEAGSEIAEPAPVAAGQLEVPVPAQARPIPPEPVPAAPEPRPPMPIHPPRPVLPQSAPWQVVAPEEPGPEQPQPTAQPSDERARRAWLLRARRPEQGQLSQRITRTVWEESSREVVTRPGSGVQTCQGCGLPLSASARFCRRCGARQA